MMLQEDREVARPVDPRRLLEAVGQPREVGPHDDQVLGADRRGRIRAHLVSTSPRPLTSRYSGIRPPVNNMVNTITNITTLRRPNCLRDRP